MHRGGVRGGGHIKIKFSINECAWVNGLWILTQGVSGAGGVRNSHHRTCIPFFVPGEIVCK